MALAIVTHWTKLKNQELDYFSCTVAEAQPTLLKNEAVHRRYIASVHPSTAAYKFLLCGLRPYPTNLLTRHRE